MFSKEEFDPLVHPEIEPIVLEAEHFVRSLYHVLRTRGDEEALRAKLSNRHFYVEQIV